ncbi:MAG: hypothetical protein ACUVX1_16215 [Chloroflexota bacterium]
MSVQTWWKVLFGSFFLAGVGVAVTFIDISDRMSFAGLMLVVASAPGIVLSMGAINEYYRRRRQQKTTSKAGRKGKP